MAKTWIALLAAGLMVLGTGCDKKDAGNTVKGAAKGALKGAAKAVGINTAPNFIEYIPADTPYAVVALEPMPDKMIDMVFKMVEPLLGQAKSEMSKELARLKQSERTEDKVGAAIIEELQGNLSRKGLEKMGFDLTPRFAVYGLGVLPVMRFELSDPKALRAMIGRIEAKAGQKLPVKKMGDVEYWGVDENKMTFAAAIIGDELIAGVTPTASAEKMLPIMFGKAKPPKSFKDSGVLEGIQKKYGFTGHAIGYVDVQIITQILLNESKGLNADVWNAMGSPVPPVPAECKTDYTSMAANFPRMVMGYTKLTAKSLSAEYIIETRSDIAKGLAGIVAPVPGMGSADGALFSVGVGLDVNKSVAFAKKVVADLKAKPYTCPHLKDLNEGLAQAEVGLNQALPPMATAITGLNVVLYDGEFGQGEPKNIKATALLVTSDAQGLLTMAKGFGPPPLNDLTVSDDGKPVPLPAGLAPPFLVEPHVAITKVGLAMSIGAGLKESLGKVLGASPPAKPSLFTISYDIKRVMDLMKKSGAPIGEDEMMVFDALGGAFGVVQYGMRFTEHGIVFDQSANFN